MNRLVFKNTCQTTAEKKIYHSIQQQARFFVYLFCYSSFNQEYLYSRRQQLSTEITNGIWQLITLLLCISTFIFLFSLYVHLFKVTCFKKMFNCILNNCCKMFQSSVEMYITLHGSQECWTIKQIKVVSEVSHNRPQGTDHQKTFNWYYNQVAIKHY